MSLTVSVFLLCVCIASNVMANVKVCSLKPETGICLAAFWNWHHVNGVCKEFLYGGCGGNLNNFQTREECERKCVVCNLPSETGPCRMRLERWFYDNGVCKKFVYGGCAGNDNRFETLNACQRACTIERQYT